MQSLAYVWLAWGNSKQIPHNPGIFDGVRTLPPPPKKKRKTTHKKKKNIPRNETSSLCHHETCPETSNTLYKSNDEENHPPISSCAAIVTILNCASVLSAQVLPAYQLRASRKAPSATRFMPAASQQLSSYTKLWMIHQRYNVNVCICI